MDVLLSALCVMSYVKKFQEETQPRSPFPSRINQNHSEGCFKLLLFFFHDKLLLSGGEWCMA